MKKNHKLLFIVFVLLCLCSCSANYNNKHTDLPPGQTLESNLVDNTSPVTSKGTPSLDQLKLKAQGNYNYESIYAFLTGDTETLANYDVDRRDPAMYEHIKTVKVGYYEVTEFDTNTLDFKFTVTESKSAAMPVGNYHFTIWNCWHPVGHEAEFINTYPEIVQITTHLADSYCISWENGEFTSYENKFNLSVYDAVTYYLANYTDVEVDYFNMDEKTVQEAAERLFGIENITIPQELVYHAPATVKTITDIRKDENGNFEVDIQYYGDRLRMVLSHKVTLYIKKTDDPVYKYFFEKAVITEKSEYDPCVFAAW